MEQPEQELGPAAAYSASVAEWLNQAYHAHMIQVLYDHVHVQGSGPVFLAHTTELSLCRPHMIVSGF